ncbi:hypothetical protein TNIN_30681 [Trichonephila inaurata madagascariensis]|uniref:Uncharacterized protein n=1 Tax=Trichonephila inaurata madagascariensis TaxID=2747483 RepID=A0A8X7BZT0_9ARAC|nr:hypothetical protein TNIN_30681 [Trichonephila inaurata madagascariensis]
MILPDNPRISPDEAFFKHLNHFGVGHLLVECFYSLHTTQFAEEAKLRSTIAGTRQYVVHNYLGSLLSFQRNTQCSKFSLVYSIVLQEV